MTDSRFLRAVILSLVVLILVACGPEESAVDQGAMKAEAQRIAAAYSAAPNLDIAKAELAKVDVPNVNQWFKYITEESISLNDNAGETSAFVHLALDLGLRSPTIERFGVDAGMIEAPAAVEVPVPADSALGRASSSVIDAFKASDSEQQVDQQAEAQKIELVPVEQVAASEVVESAATQEETIQEETTQEDVTATDENSAENAESVDKAEETSAETVEAEAPAEAPADPLAVADAGMNVREGPGINYNIVGALQAGENATVLAKNPTGDWWQVRLATGVTGWLYSQLTTVEGDVSGVAVAANIPQPPPPTATPLPPTPFPTPTFTYAPPTAAPAVATVAPVAPAPVATQPPAQAPAPEKPATGGNTFKLVERRLWGVQENGGFLAGESVNCGDKRELRVRVIDAAGNPINGVTVHGVYTKVDVATGSQGKGDGVAEYVLGDGEDVKIIRDADGSEASSDVATGMVTKPHLIDTPSLIQAGYCSDDASCKKNVVDPYACGGHYSWDIKFQRSY